MTVKIDTLNTKDNKVTKKQYSFDPIEEINIGLLHQVVKGSRTNYRNNTATVKTRAQVSGTGAKPWAQKGTGRARQGSLRSPQFVGGGVAHGPGTRVYKDRTPKKMKRLALRSALSDRASSNSVYVVDAWEFETPSTKAAKTALEAIGAEGKVLIIADLQDVNTEKSFRNLSNVNVLSSDQLNVFDILVSDSIVFTKNNLPTMNQVEASSQPDNDTEEA